MRQFGDLTASEIYCSRCKQSQPVRERLLLILPTGELHEYLCRICGESVGERQVTGPPLGAQIAATPSPTSRANARQRR